MRPNTTFKRFLCFSEFPLLYSSTQMSPTTTFMLFQYFTVVPLLNSSTQMRPTSTFKRMLYLTVIFEHPNAPNYNFQAVPVLL